MKKLIIYLVVLTLMVSFVSAATVSRDMPSTIEPGSELTVSFNVADMEVGKSVAISDTIPSQFTLKDWSVTGATKGDVTYEISGSDEHRWEIPATAASVKLTYTIDVPASASGAYSFNAVYFAPPSKMDELKATLNIGAAAPTPTPPAETPPPTTEPAEEAAGGIPTGVIIAVAVIVIGLIVYFVIAKKKKAAPPK